MQTSALVPAWDRIDTVLVDMDGTLLDLAFDNFFWLELVPAKYADLHGLSADEAQRRLTARFESTVGTLAWYCTDHWSRDLGLDINALKWAHKHRIALLPGAREFLAAVRARGKRLWIVTNAHQETIAVKTEQTGVHALVDRVICSHELSAPKESQQFWHALQHEQPFDPSRTLLIEDSLLVLAAASAYGVRHAIAIRRPDSRLPPRQIADYPAVDGVAELV
ncbi:MAG TPA: GMP/IMP nucleotidase [Gammaproteobacteria bacterium]|nr:GMP/IMP nucleotidase [Gammaproteobacteria bacterium]